MRGQRSNQNSNFLNVFALAFIFFSIVTWSAPGDCYHLFNQLKNQKLTGEALQLKAAGTDTELAFAFEKEGSWYPELPRGWFDLDPGHIQRVLQVRLDAETKGKKDPVLTKFLKNFLDTDDPKWILAPAELRRKISKSQWEKLTSQQRLQFLLEQKDIKRSLTQTAWGHLFYEEVLNFERLIPGANKPEFIKVTNDLGSYELVSRGETDRSAFQQMRATVEDALEGPIGHQHIVHAWPSSREARAEIAPQYIELLDSGTWFLFWRQMERNPEEIDSILGHEFLGVYPRSSLDRIYERMLEGDSEHAKDKYRMIGLRSMKGRASMPGQSEDQFYPDFELRSGNKGSKRDFMEDMLQARIASGDYSGLRDFRSYSFDPGAPLGKILRDTGPQTRAVLEAFYEAMPKQRSDNRFYRKDLRNKIFSPFLDWEQRLGSHLDTQRVEEARAQYEKKLSEIAKNYLKRKARTEKPKSLEKLWEETLGKVEEAIYEFAKSTQLAKSFETYLVPRASTLPEVLVKSDGPIDVNQINLGIEYSFRFLTKPTSKKEAKAQVGKTASELAQALGATEVKLEEDPKGHGHGLGFKYTFEDEKGKKWRVEWDGIQRYYRKGQAIAPRGGHIEIPTPKGSPQDTTQISALYEANRTLGQVPSRAAGGAHINIDLKPFIDLPGNVGPRKLVDFISLFENHRQMIQFLWQHPHRTSAAFPLAISPELQKELGSFSGNWDELGKLLYEHRQFNPYEGRKPGYTQLNLTALMADQVPERLQKTIDIKNPSTPWFPAFGGKGTDRIELRLFDAPPDEYLAALQVKYIRALLNKSVNSESKILISPRHTIEDFETWKADGNRFLEAATEHLLDLGLDTKEFLPLLVDSYQTQQVPLPKPKPLVEADPQNF